MNEFNRESQSFTNISKNNGLSASGNIYTMNMEYFDYRKKR